MTVNSTVNYGKWFKEWDIAKNNILKVNEKSLYKVSRNLYTRVVNYTPVGNPSLWKYPAPKGYIPGTLKKNWKIDFRSKEVIISNDAPYGMRVEYGWSTQAPYGMLRRAIADFPTLVEQVAKESKL